jgi:hypothetical protein
LKECSSRYRKGLLRLIAAAGKMSSRLCVCCRSIPLDPELKTLNANEYDGPKTWCLGSFGEVRRRSCPFCELIASICTTRLSSWHPLTPPGDSTKIDVQYFGRGFSVEGQSQPGSYVCIAGQLAESWPICARAQFTEWIDFDDVHRWISTCEQKHGSECSPATFNPAVLPRNSDRQLDFRLIDVEAMCIVYAPRQCRYIALSYVWGRRNKSRLILTSDNEEALMEPGALALSETRTSIPNTILDTMSVVRKLRERYLWVDSLCLLQDGANELRDCVTIMDLFYEMALLTIVAASGEDAWSGLPGVPPTPRRINRLVRDIIPGLKMTTIVDMDTPLRRSVYSSRAWT